MGLLSPFVSCWGSLLQGSARHLDGALVGICWNTDTPSNIFKPSLRSGAIFARECYQMIDDQRMAGYIRESKYPDGLQPHILRFGG